MAEVPRQEPDGGDFDEVTEVAMGFPSLGPSRVAAPGFSDMAPSEAAAWEDDATAVLGATDIGGFFGERFRVDARLGVGAMGRVLTAVDTTTGAVVALKVLHPDRARDPATIERFQREAMILRELDHPAIVRLVAFGRTPDGSWWLAMEHLLGKTLKDRLARGGSFTPKEAWPILATLCDAVAAAHARGVLHRDLKPENVILLENGPPPCKLLDFGLSRYTTKPDRITANGTVLGTPRYMAPEALLEASTVDERADVFAIAAIAFEMLTGRSIYPAEDFGQLFGCILEGRVLSLRSLRPDAPPGLDRLLSEALARDPRTRVSSVDELSRRFAEAIGVSPDRSRFLASPSASGLVSASARFALAASAGRVEEPCSDAGSEFARPSSPVPISWPSERSSLAPGWNGAHAGHSPGRPSFASPPVARRRDARRTLVFWLIAAVVGALVAGGAGVVGYLLSGWLASL